MASEEIEEVIIRDYSKNDSRRAIEYKVIRTLGEGGFGKVLHVKRTKFDFKEGKQIDVEYALKTIPKLDILNDKKLKHRVITEIKIHRQLKHENICKFDYSFDDKYNVNIVIEYCPNSTLQELFRFRNQITEFEVRYYMFQVLQALIYLRRQKIIHRDLTLSNIFLSKNNIVKVGDFGLSFKETSEEDKRGKVCGTEPYLALELTGALVTYSYKTDIWAFGVCIYELLTGRRLFENPEHAKELIDNNPLDHGPRLSDEARDLLSKIFVKDIERIELQDIYSHAFFNSGFDLNVTMPSYTKDTEKDFFHEIDDWKKKVKITFTKEVLGLTRKDKNNDEAQFPLHRNNNSNEYNHQSIIKRSSMIGMNTKEEEEINKVKNDREHLQNEVQQVNEANQLLMNTDRYNNYSRTNKRMSTINTIQPKPIDYIKKKIDFEIEAKIENPFKFRTSILKESSNSLLRGNLLKDIASQINEEEAEETKETISYETIVINYLDKSSKYGIGYKLNNGMYGAYFNDGVKLVLNNKEIYLWNKDFNHQFLVFPLTSLEKGSTGYISNDIINRYQIMAIFIEELTKKNQKESIDTGLLQYEKLVYLKKWKRTRKALFFLLSNKNIQVNFYDKTMIVFHYKNKLIRYYNESNIVTQFYADPITSFYSDNQEIHSKISYSIREFLKDD